MPRVDEGLAPGLPGLSDGPGLSQTPGLWNQFLGLSGDTTNPTPPGTGGQLVLNSAEQTNFTYFLGWY